MATNSVNLSKNYYKILEVDHSCDQKVIKNSYLKLVKTLHPDVNPNGKQKFTQVQEAYEVLSDKDLKKYYDQNNHCKNASQSKGPGDSSSSYQSGTNQRGQTKKSSSGHEYYTHRTYKSEDPRDYYNDNEAPKYQQKKDAKNKKPSQQNEDSEDEPFRRQSFYRNSQNFSRGSWEFYHEQKRREEERVYGQETAQERQMRDKIKSMRGFTSQYNVMWSKSQLNGENFMCQNKKKQREEEIKRIVPEKVRKFYDKMMDKLEEIAQKNAD